MEFNFESQREYIASELNKRAPNFKCPVCGTNEFGWGEGYFANDIQKALNQRQIGGINIPTVPIICRNCGFLMQFAAGTLGLLPEQKKIPNEEHGQ